MLSAIKSILSNKISTKQSKPATKDKIQLAASVLLLEAAHADDECSKEELSHIVNTLHKIFKMNDQCAKELIELASQRREQEVDLWQFTNLINTASSHQEKLTIMQTVWQVIYMDGKLDSHEDYFAHKLANLLHISHSELIDAKLKAKSDQTAQTALKA